MNPKKMFYQTNEKFQYLFFLSLKLFLSYSNQLYFPFIFPSPPSTITNFTFYFSLGISFFLSNRMNFFNKVYTFYSNRTEIILNFLTLANVQGRPLGLYEK